MICGTDAVIINKLYRLHFCAQIAIQARRHNLHRFRRDASAAIDDVALPKKKKKHYLLRGIPYPMCIPSQNKSRNSRLFSNNANALYALSL